ncbi:MAG TPA: hypothetical protein VFT84_03045 [Gemmatimonadales bacterium]|nr:hypothetical protein [Gemmatimonadales bacterium]
MTASLLLLLLTAAAPAAPADTSTLEFRGFRAGARLEEINAVVRRLDGRLRCDGARADRRVTECRGRFLDAESGENVALWISAIDSVAGIITLRSDTPGDRLDHWRDGIVARYGKVGARAQGTQWMMQWVRRGRMLRLTWRDERGGRVASVSLVDGRVLDGWGRDRARTKVVSRDTLPGQPPDSL